MITAQVERLHDILETEVKPLLPLHWEMLALNKDKVPLDPQYETYLAEEDLGQLCFVALRDSGKLVGYWICNVSPGKHYKTCLTSIMDIFFVHPDYRSGSAAIVLMRAVEREMRRRGVQRWMAGEKLHSPVGRLFTAFGFEKIECTYSKWLGAKV